MKLTVQALSIGFLFFCLLKWAGVHSDSIKNAGIYLSILAYLFSYCFLRVKASKKKYDSSEVYRNTLELVDEGIILLDPTLSVKFFNSTFASFLGVQRVYGSSFYEMDVQKNQELFDFITTLLKRSYQYKIFLKEKIAMQKSCVTFEVVLSPLDDKRGYAILVKDTTKNLRGVSMGKEFISNATHELRTPITIIKGFIETLRDLPEISEDMLEDISDKILRSCHRMDRIVKNLLILTDLDHLSKLEFKNFDLEALIDNCQHNLTMLFPNVKIIYQNLAENSMIFADPDLLELAVMNLMQNAVKYSKEPAQIDIQIKKNKQDVSISIADRGQGIPEEFQERIFDRFVSVDKAESRKLGGAGLGLSIVKSIIDKHKGKIIVSSNGGKGSIFTMSLPLH